MHNKTRNGSNALSLESENFGEYVSDFCFEELLQSGVLIKVSGWVIREMGFSLKGLRVNAVITASLWKTIISVPTYVQQFQSIRGRGNDVMWQAAYALQIARERGAEIARFQTFLPSSDLDAAAEKVLRVEYTEQGGREWVTIGLAEEIAIR